MSCASTTLPSEADRGLAGRLEGLLLDTLALPCVTGEEGPMADWLADRCNDEQVTRIGNSVVAGDLDDPRPMVLLVSHLDVVPPTDADREPRVEAERIVGRGSSDMKSGLVASLDVFGDPVLRAGPVNLVLVGYAGEEGPHEGNELSMVLERAPALVDAALAVVLEPTDLEVQLGCLGGLHARVIFDGRAAHSARPWHGENALTKAGDLLAELDRRAPEIVAVDGLEYRDVLSATQAWTDNARNVVPDRFTINVNYRFSPTRSLAQAEERLRAVVGDRARVELVDRAPPAAPRRHDPFVERFVSAAGATVTPKQAWTDVARFAGLGVPALNYGPGLVAQAHQAGEWIPRENLVVARRALARFLEA
jgi:succinyl-diaminopimelate desuccinylase